MIRDYRIIFNTRKYLTKGSSRTTHTSNTEKKEAEAEDTQSDLVFTMDFFKSITCNNMS